MVVEIENPDSVSIETEDGGMIIDFDPDPSQTMLLLMQTLLSTLIKILDMLGIRVDFSI